MKIQPTYVTVVSLGLGLLLSSCRQEPLPEQGGGGRAVFAVSETIPDLETKSTGAESVNLADGRVLAMEQWLPVREGATKASAVYASADATPLGGTPIAVWAYNLSAADAAVSAWKVDDGSASGAVQASYSGGKWITSVPYNSSKRAASWFTRWFALAPYGAIGSGVTLGSIADGTAPTLSYTVPASVTSQPDLMLASTAARGVDDKTDIGLSFSHVLTGIRLAADDGVNLTSATLSGVYDRASLNLLTREWSGLEKSKTTPSFTQNGSFDQNAGVFMMLPQWLPAGAKLTLTVDGDTVEADLSGHEWKMGKLVTYRVAVPHKAGEHSIRPPREE